MTTKNDRKLLHVTRIELRWADMDANAHVNNATYFTYMEQARIEWLNAAGMQNTAEGEGPVVVKTSCTYLAPIGYPETLEVRVYGAAPGRTSFPTWYEINGAAGARYAEGDATMVWTNRASGKSQPVPDALRALLAGP
ncbi:MAG TPA: thioesterase family protein [Burkholderiales bacterium]|nr:thioesterase family protein [Burkholderiales bacterium]